MHVFRILSVIFPLVFQVFAHDEDVYTIKYTVDNFAEEVPKKHHFIMFYAPWCGFCKKLGPTWEQLAEMLNEDDSNIKIAKVDCTTDSSICSDLDVTGYPTLKFFKVGDSEGVRFRGTRDLPTLTNFINEQLRSGDDAEESKTVPITDNGLKELTEENFEKETEKGRTFVKFYAPWCGHCQKLAPVWDELAKSMESNDAVSVGKIDCTQFRTICNNFEVKGYPTLLWLEDGKKIEKYQGDRSLEDLKNYVNKMLGSSNENVIEEAPEADLKAVRDLTGGDFRSGIESGVTFVKFFAPWCGHCKRLAPTWEELGSRFAEKIGVGIAKVDCTLEENKELCNEQEIEGFPSLFLYKDGKKISEYSGSRSLDDLAEFVNSHIRHDEL